MFYQIFPTFVQNYHLSTDDGDNDDDRRRLGLLFSTKDQLCSSLLR